MRLELDLGDKRYSHFSLLFEEENCKDVFTLNEADINDLQFDQIIENLEGLKLKDCIKHVQQIPKKKSTSVYRQQIMTDIIKNPEAFKSLLQIGEDSHRLLSLGKFAFEKEATVYNLMKRVKDVDVIKKMLTNAYQALQVSGVKSAGLLGYKQLLKSIIDSDIYDSFISDVKSLNELDEGIKSLKIGMNLNEYLEPEEAILLELSKEEFKYSRFAKKMGYYIEYGFNELKSIPRMLFARETIAAPDALNRLEKTIEPATLQLIKFCDQFTGKILEVLSILYHELPYYQIGFELYNRIEKLGHRQCQPIWEDNLVLRQVYNCHLGVTKRKEEVVTNTFEFTPEKRIFILTGANRGGKTTMTQALAQCIWLGQLGYYIPADKVVVPHMTGLFVHFPKEENETVNFGRLGDECYRFKQIFDELSESSILFMNESFSGTSHYESLELATGSVQALANTQAYVIYNTHLHELVDSIEKTIDISLIESLVAGKNMEKSPYLIEKGRPLGKSYALNIAKKYGMSYEQLLENGS